MQVVGCLTLCLNFLHGIKMKIPKMNSLTQTATLEPTPEAALFIRSRSYGTKSKAFKKCNYHHFYPGSLMQGISYVLAIVPNWLSQEYPSINVC